MKREYPCIEINIDKISHNTNEILNICRRYQISVTAVSKVFCARRPIVSAMVRSGIKTIGDSRLENLKRIQEIDCQKLLLRIPMESSAMDVVKYSDISLNSEVDTIASLSEAAKKINKVHNIILMIDEGDLREGILENDAIDTVKKILVLENIRLIGIGTNLTCYGGVIPDEQNLGKLVTLKSKLDKTFNIQIPVVSGGNSSSLYMVMNGTIPKGINQLRIGEAIVLGRETAYGNYIKNCYNDSFILKGEIIELKNKPSVPTGKIGMDAFGGTPHFDDKGIMKRAIVAVGRQDIKVEGLVPIDDGIRLLGASSDHLLLDVTASKAEYKVGSIIDFKMDYGCLLASMTSPYVKKYYVGHRQY